MILSTELQRSTRGEEDKKLVDKLLASIDKLGAGAKVDVEKVKQDVLTPEAKQRGSGRRDLLKTDGDRLMTAFRIEQRSEIIYQITDARELVRSH